MALNRQERLSGVTSVNREQHEADVFACPPWSLNGQQAHRDGAGEWRAVRALLTIDPDPRRRAVKVASAGGCKGAWREAAGT